MPTAALLEWLHQASGWGSLMTVYGEWSKLTMVVGHELELTSRLTSIYVLKR